MKLDLLNDLEQYIAAERYRLVNSVLIYQHDELIYEKYFNQFTPETRNTLMSVWKSILSLTLGICLDNGWVRGLDEPIKNHLPPFNEGRHLFHRFITVRHLLTMSSGIYWNSGVHYSCPLMDQLRNSNANWLDYIAEIPVAHTPGNHFQYKEWDVILLSAYISGATGKSPYDICRKYIYDPLEISSGIWPSTACGVVYNVQPGMEGSDLCARDMAKIGLLALHGGEWNGQRVVSESYIKQSAAPSPAWNGYGFLWWLSEHGFHGRGFGGQEINVYPAENAVAVIQATATASDKSYGDVCNHLF